MFSLLCRLLVFLGAFWLGVSLGMGAVDAGAGGGGSEGAGGRARPAPTCARSSHGAGATGGREAGPETRPGRYRFSKPTAIGPTRDRDRSRERRGRRRTSRDRATSTVLDAAHAAETARARIDACGYRRRRLGAPELLSVFQAHRYRRHKGPLSVAQEKRPRSDAGAAGATPPSGAVRGRGAGRNHGEGAVSAPFWVSASA